MKILAQYDFDDEDNQEITGIIVIPELPDTATTDEAVRYALQNQIPTTPIQNDDKKPETWNSSPDFANTPYR